MLDDLNMALVMVWPAPPSPWSLRGSILAPDDASATSIRKNSFMALLTVPNFKVSLAATLVRAAMPYVMLSEPLPFLTIALPAGLQGRADYCQKAQIHHQRR